MLEFVILVTVLSILSKIPAAVEIDEQPYNPEWDFRNVDDCFEFRELRQTGWKGNAEDFYRLKEEEK